MSLRSDPRQSRRGFTMLEMLVTVAILAAMLAVAASTARGPSGQALLKAEAIRIANEAMTARLRAMDSTEPQTYRPVSDQIEITPCDGGIDAPTLVYRRDGGTDTQTLCLRTNDRELRLKVDWLTGQIVEDGT